MTKPYTMTVFHEGDPAATETLTADRAPEVLDSIQTLVIKYPDCHRIVVASQDVHLFSVDRFGKVVAD